MKKSFAVDKYKKMAIMTSFPVELMMLLLEKTRREVQFGEKAIECKDIVTRNQHLQSAQLYINEMSFLLNPKCFGYRDYIKMLQYFHYLLVQANVLNDIKFLLELDQHLEMLLENWKWFSKNKK